VTIKEFIIETEDPGILFESIFSIGFGSIIFVKEETFSFFVSIARELFHWALSFVLPEICNKNVKVSELCKEFGDCEMKEDFLDGEVEFVSSHVSEIDSSPLSFLISEPNIEQLEPFFRWTDPRLGQPKVR
jgi:hypothetical protein